MTELIHLAVFSWPFMQRALIAAVIVAISASLLGTFLVLKNQSLIGDGLAHVSFGAVAIALVLGQSPLFFTLPFAIAAALFIRYLTHKAAVKGDAAIGIVSATAMAFGVTIISLSRGVNIDISNYLFGDILTVNRSNLNVAFILLGAVILFVGYFYHRLFSVTYDSEYGKFTKINVSALDYALSALTAFTIVVGIRLVGTLLISSMIIFPTLSALTFARGFKQTLLYAATIAAFTAFFGIIVSFYANTPSGASIVLLHAVLFSVLLIVRSFRRWIRGGIL